MRGVANGAAPPLVIKARLHPRLGALYERYAAIETGRRSSEAAYVLRLHAEGFGVDKRPQAQPSTSGATGTINLKLLLEPYMGAVYLKYASIPPRRRSREAVQILRLEAEANGEGQGARDVARSPKHSSLRLEDDLQPAAVRANAKAVSSSLIGADMF